MLIDIIPAGRTFLRPGGREGGWNTDPETRDPDDAVVSPFDFTEVSGDFAETALDELKRLRPGLTPMLFGSPHDAGMLFERMQYLEERPQDWLAQTRSFDIDQWLQERQVEHEENQDPDEPFPPRRPWPVDTQPMTALHVPNQLLNPGRKPTVIIGLLPSDDPTEAAAYLNFGGWNDCPMPPVHMAFARRWREQYGAVQVSNTHDVVEFRVAKPITSRDEAMTLAWLQYHYCTDSIPGSLEESAAGLIGSTVWYFWWD